MKRLKRKACQLLEKAFIASLRGFYSATVCTINDKLHYYGAIRVSAGTEMVQKCNDCGFLHRERDHKLTGTRLFIRDGCDLV
ncbi:hypothetical protein FR965_15815 [Serratia marcescens]|nr:hypothetical protein AM681_25350 [Serratia marcescens]AVU42790.1 hypothetical protein AS658_25010 [Serratia marcescens]TWY28766.1 hypothetical protein FR965_15815 [Serratia marcescens]HAU4403064.1 hypothetical protein [Serratia marcescens]